METKEVKRGGKKVRQFLCTLNRAHAKDQWVYEHDMYMRKTASGELRPYRHKDCERIISAEQHRAKTKKANGKAKPKKATSRKRVAKRAAA